MPLLKKNVKLFMIDWKKCSEYTSIDAMGAIKYHEINACYLSKCLKSMM